MDFDFKISFNMSTWITIFLIDKTTFSHDNKLFNHICRFNIIGKLCIFVFLCSHSTHFDYRQFKWRLKFFESYLHLFFLPTSTTLMHTSWQEAYSVTQVSVHVYISLTSFFFSTFLYRRVPGSFGSNESKTEFRRNQRGWLAYIYTTSALCVIKKFILTQIYQLKQTKILISLNLNVGFCNLSWL